MGATARGGTDTGGVVTPSIGATWGPGDGTTCDGGVSNADVTTGTSGMVCGCGKCDGRGGGRERAITGTCDAGDENGGTAPTVPKGRVLHDAVRTGAMPVAGGATGLVPKTCAWILRRLACSFRNGIDFSNSSELSFVGLC